MEKQDKKQGLKWSSVLGGVFVGCILVFQYLIFLELNRFGVEEQAVTKKKIATTSSHDHDNASTTKCLSLDKNFASSGAAADDKNLEYIISKTKQVFITMPAKTSGSTMKKFVKKCSNKYDISDNFLNFDKEIKNFVQETLDLPTIVASHMGNDRAFQRIVRGVTRESLLIFIYRHESDRFISATRQVVESTCMNMLQNRWPELREKFLAFVSLEGKDCIVDQSAILDHIIGDGKVRELGMSTYNALSCNSYSTLDEHKPSNMVFIHYKKVDQLQRLLSKYHCPNLLSEEAVHANIAANKETKMFVKTAKSNLTVPLDEWLEKKKNFLQFAGDTNAKYSCVGKTKDIERKLMACKDNVLQYSGTSQESASVVYRA